MLILHVSCKFPENLESLFAVVKDQVLAQRSSVGSSEESMMVVLGNVEAYKQVLFRTPYGVAYAVEQVKSSTCLKHFILLLFRIKWLFDNRRKLEVQDCYIKTFSVDSRGAKSNRDLHITDLKS